MRNLSKIFGLALFLNAGPIYAQTYLESNREDVKCEWISPKGNGKGICHIVAQGTQMDETTTSFRIENNPELFTISDKEKPTITIQTGENDWKVIWKGELVDDDWKNTRGYHAIETIKLSNGYTIKLYR